MRYFRGISPPYDDWNFDFVLYRRGDKEPIDASPHSPPLARSISLEFPELDQGDYIVHVSSVETTLYFGAECGPQCRLDKVPFSENVRLFRRF